MNIVFESKDGYLFGSKPNSSEKSQTTDTTSVAYLSEKDSKLYGYKA